MAESRAYSIDNAADNHNVHAMMMVEAFGLLSTVSICRACMIEGTMLMMSVDRLEGHPGLTDTIHMLPILYSPGRSIFRYMNRISCLYDAYRLQLCNDAQLPDNLRLKRAAGSCSLKHSGR